MIPTISIIIPTYNRAALLKETLESVLAQTYTDYEIIIIDDGSTDHTEETVQAFLTDDRIRYIKQPNAGVSVARNHGIFEARGEWIAFLDSDDLWFPDKLEKQMAFLAEHPTAGAVCCPAYAYQDGQIQKNEEGMMIRLHTERNTSVLPFELFATTNYVWPSSVVVRKLILYHAGLFEGGLKIGEDFCLWVKIARFTDFWLINDVLGCFRFHETNTYAYESRGNSESQFYDRMVRKLQMVRWSDEPYIVERYREWFLDQYGDFAYYYRQERNYKESAHYYWHTLEYAHGMKLRGKIFVKFIIAKFFPFVFRIWDKWHRYP